MAGHLPVVGRCDGVEPLLAGGVPDLQLDLLAAQLDRLDLEVDPDRRDERVVEGVVREPEEDARLPHPGVADQEQLEQQVVALLRHSVGFCVFTGGWFKTIGGGFVRCRSTQT